jgi:2-polyprenyl-3-methyl-5-hydroxy-6-metoxy-1,4-benzoquinol methylase
VIIKQLKQTAMTKFYYTKGIADEKLKILDIGLDNSSVVNAKLIYQNHKEYHGIDIVDINQAEKKIDKFFLMNLEDLDFDIIEDEYYDLILMNHVLEHTINGHEIIDKLSAKLKLGGHFFIEFPNVNSLYKRNYFTYHFHCDSTHKRIYKVSDIANILLLNNCEIISAGYSKPIWKYIYLAPKLIIDLILRNEMGASLAHISNKISHVYAKKNN